MSIDRYTPYRDVGSVPFSVWNNTVSQYGGRATLGSEKAWKAAGPLSAVLLRILIQESSVDTDYRANSKANNNPYNIRVKDRSNEDNPKGYIAYPDLVTATKAAADRINGADGFFDGPNPYADAVTIEDLLMTYAPPKWNDTEGLIDKMESQLNAWLPDWSPPVTTPSTDPEPIPGEGVPMAEPESIKPSFIVAPVTKRADGQGFNYGTRAPIVGLVIHETQGIDSGKGYQKFFSCLTDTSCKDYGICSDGERCQNALVDWLIDQQGQLFEYQDPYDTNRIPWASGGTENNSNPIGRAINAKYRQFYGGVNRVYAAVEMVKTDNGDLTPAQIQTAGKLLAFVMAKAGYPADDWEYPDALGGNIYTAPHHSDVSQTTCRISDSDKAAIKRVCATTLAAYEQGTTPGEEPTTPPTPPPATDIIPGVDLAIAKRLFGIAKGEDGLNYSYDPDGPVSKLWTERGKATGEWPALAQVLSYEDGKRRYFLFDGGPTVIAVKGQEPKWLKEAA
jgi:hypothetical protein